MAGQLTDASSAQAHVLAAGRPWSVVLRRGQRLRVEDLEGQQAVDLLCYNDARREHRYSAPNTIKAAGTLRLTTGHTLYSDAAQPLLTIVADSFGGHDTIGGCCSAASNELLYGTRGRAGCRENFLEGLAEHGLGWRDIVPNLNLFMEVPVDTGGRTAIAAGRSRPGEAVELGAQTDVLVVLSNCPQINNPCNGFRPTPVRVEVRDGTAT